MNVTTHHATLASALAATAPISMKWSSMPIFCNVLLDAREDGLWLTCTNNDIRVTRRIDADVVGAGSITVPARDLRRMVEYLGVAPVDLSTAPGREVLVMKSGARALRLRGLAAEEFPDRLPIDQPAAISLDRAELRAAIQRVAVAMARDESRPALNGVLVKLAGSELLLVAADGFRLHIDRLSVESPVEFDFILPGDAVRHLVRLLTGKGDVKLVIGAQSTSGQDVRFDLGDTTLTSRTIDAAFPKYESIVPKGHATRVTVDRRQLLTAIRLASIVARDANNIVSLDLAGASLVVSAKNSDFGEASDEIPAEIEGPLMPLALNTAFLIEALCAFRTDAVVLDLTTPARAIVIGGPHVALQVVVMPIHTMATQEYERRHNSASVKAGVG